jgi:iron complex outermembrane receptor protein
LQILSSTASKIQWITGAFFMVRDQGYDPLNFVGTLVPPDYLISARQKTHSVSGFAQGTIPLFSDNTRLTGGVRYTSDRQNVIGTSYIGGAPRAPVADNTTTFDKVTFKGSLDHDFAQDVMGYLSYSRGFKSGLYYVAAPTAAPVKPEVVDAIEIGLKSEFFDRRLRVNVAGFQEKVKDLQVLLVTTGAGYLVNAASSRTRGVEIEVTAAPVNNFTLSAGLAYIHAIFTNFPDAPLYIPNPAGGNTIGTVDAAGNPVSLTPKWSFNASPAYKFETSAGEINASLAYSYTSRQYWYPDLVTSQGRISMLNSSVQWFPTGARWNTRLWVKNLLNEKIYSYELEQAPGNSGSPAAPRTYGISLGYKY